MSLRSLFDSLFTVLGSRSSAPRPHRLRALTFFQPSTFNVQLRARALKGGPTRPGDGILLSERMNETAVVPHRPFQLSTFNFQLLARALALLAVCAPSLHAQQKPNENAQVLMNFKTTGYGIATGSRYRVTLGTGVWTVADVVDTWVSGQGTSAWSTSPQYAVPLTPGQFYQLLVDPGTNNSEVLFSPPPGYSVYQSVGNDLMPITSWHTTNVNNGQILPFTILPSGGILPAGQSTSPKAGNIVWSVGVGHQTNGTSAGLIQMRAQDISAASFSADSLFYAAPSGVTVTPDSAVLGGSPYTSSRRVIYAPEAMVLFRPISSTSYNIEFFDPSFHAVWGNDAYFHVYDSGNNLQDVSSNYYTVSQLSDGSLNIGYYCVMQQNTPARLARSWTVSHSSGLIWGITQDDLVRKVVGSSVANSSGDRVETTTTTSEDGTTIATKTVRTYHVFPWSQEEITSEVADPDGLALTTTYDYYTDSSATGYGKLKTLYRPDGSWERYWYRSDDASYGLLDAVLRPWQDSTITPDQA
ncbi:MAG TPA: hypothetical protein VKC60_04445, partial [Opitutaceae bacterium]|nr:hypothetical protein [Opitutaceae bacterium]